MADFRYQSLFEAFQEGSDREAARQSQRNEDLSNLANDLQNSARLDLESQRLYFDTVVQPELDRQNAAIEFERELDILQRQQDFQYERDQRGFDHEFSIEAERRRSAEIEQENRNQLRQFEDAQNTDRRAEIDARTRLQNEYAAINAKIDALESTGGADASGQTNAALQAAYAERDAFLQRHSDILAGDEQSGGLLQFRPDANLVQTPGYDTPAPGMVPVPPEEVSPIRGTPPASGEAVLQDAAFQPRALGLDTALGRETAAALNIRPGSTDALSVVRTSHTDRYNAAYAAPISNSLGARRAEVAQAFNVAMNYAILPDSVASSPQDIARIAYLFSVTAKIENDGRVFNGARQGVELQSGAHQGDRAQGGFQIMPKTGLQPQYGAPDVFAVARKLGVPTTGRRTVAESARLLRNPVVNSVFALNLISRAYVYTGGNMNATMLAHVGGAGTARRYLQTGRVTNAHAREYLQKFGKYARADNMFVPRGVTT